MGFSFEGKKVLVTGGAGGLGGEIVRKFVESGAIVYALDCSEESLQELKSSLPQAETVLADLKNWNEVRNIVDGLGPLDHLVNCAGIAIFESILDVSEESLDRTLNINLKAAFNLSQIFCKAAIANSIKSATIVNVSSTLSVVHTLWLGTYACSKAAMDMMTKAFAVEMGPHGIRVNSILPTAMPTKLFGSAPDNLPDNKAEICQKRTPLGGINGSGMMEIADAANLVLYLSSDLSQMITGTNIPIDGGCLASL